MTINKISFKINGFIQDVCDFGFDLFKKAFEMFKELVEKLKKLKCEYEKNFGPLEAYNSAAFGSFKWIDSPWPWEREANI